MVATLDLLAKAIAKYLPYFDWLLWTDGDVAVMNENFRLEEFVQGDGREIDLVLDDHTGPISAGAFLLRNSAWSRWFLQHWEEQDVLQSVWEDNGALYHALLWLAPGYRGQCSTPNITQSHDNLVACLQHHLDLSAGPYGQRALPHVKFMNPLRTDGHARGIAFWDREWAWPRELQYQNGDFMLHSKDVPRYADPRLRKHCGKS